MRFHFPAWRSFVTRHAHALTVCALFVAVSLTWGTTWLAMKVAVDTIPPLFATGMRFLFAAPFLLLLAALTQTPLCFPPGQRGFQVVVSLFYFAIPFTLMIYGERYVSPALASLLFAAMPVAVMAASALILQDRISRRQTAGLILATAALALILLNEAKTAVQGHWRGIAALAVAVIMHAILYAQCKKRSARLPVLTFNALPCLAAGGLLLLAGSLLESPAPTTFAFRSVMATLYLGAVAGVFGILCYFALQQRAGPFRASLAFLVFPVIAVGLDAWLANTPLSPASLLLMLPLGLGILLTLAVAPRPVLHTTSE